MSLEDNLVYTASTLCVISLIPEVYIAFKNKGTEISYGFLCIQITATTIWIAYEVVIDSIPLLIADSCILGQLLFLCTYKYISTKKKKMKVHPLGVGIVPQGGTP